MIIPNNVSKRFLWKFINKRINRVVRAHQVLNIIVILLQEMVKDLKDGKEIKIHNFGTLRLKNTKPRMHGNITKGNIPTMSKGYKKLEFILWRRIKNKLFSMLDLDKTFPHD